MNIWLNERPDREGTERLIARLKKVCQPKDKLRVRILPSSRFWPEYVNLLKAPVSKQENYPDIIEFPLTWYDSLLDLDILANTDDLDGATVRRWSPIAALARQSGSLPDANGLLCLPWLTGPLLLYYRADRLRSLGKDPAQMHSYAGWQDCLRSVTLGTDMIALDMPMIFPMSLWWIWSFGGDIIDPLNLMPSFCQAEAISGLTAMIETIIEHRGARFKDDIMPTLYVGGADTIFPDNVFCLFDFHTPEALMSLGGQVACAPAPIRDSRVDTAKTYAFAVTKVGLRQNAESTMSFFETLATDASLWSDAAKYSGMLPADPVLADRALQEIPQENVRATLRSAMRPNKTPAASRFLAPLAKIFFDALYKAALEALNRGKADPVRISAALAKAASEYRLMVALYDGLRIPAPPAQPLLTVKDVR
ncbi:MAG: hypothetical protein AABZ44_01340 [Elusimicrobiota bacterium]